MQQQLARLSDFFRQNREKILAEWRKAAEADPVQTTVNALSRAQFNDHIPQLLEIFEDELKLNAPLGIVQLHDEEIKHGRQRWQQGYNLTELMHEWAHLHACMARVIGEFARAHPEVEGEVFHFAYANLLRYVGDGVIESTGQYARLAQAAAAANVKALKTALAQLQDIEARRADLFRQAVHDLRGNVQAAKLAAEILQAESIPPKDRAEFAASIEEGLAAVSVLLEELMQLARLEAGQEKRRFAALNAGELIRAFCTTLAPVAAAKKLSFVTEGPDDLAIEGDADKLRRILQNLIGNAVKYTDAGGVTISWGRESKTWWLSIKDTGPGFSETGGPSMAESLQEATQDARDIPGDADVKIESQDPVIPPRIPLRKRSTVKPGEGVGLSIVKRLCELLDARIELESSAEAGTTFVIHFPLTYSA